MKYENADTMLKQHIGKVAKNEVVPVEHCIIHHQRVSSDSDDDVAPLAEQLVVNVHNLIERSIYNGMVFGIRMEIAPSDIKFDYQPGKQSGIRGAGRRC